VDPSEFEHLKAFGESLGIGHVESSPLTRSSYHARESAENVVVSVHGTDAHTEAHTEAHMDVKAVTIS
jgi:lipoic acid synthetase